MFYTFGAAIAAGVYAVDGAACREIDDALRMAESAGDDLGVIFTKYTKGLVLVHGRRRGP